MYRISVRHHFDAAHYLRGYGGRCEQVHGHRFQAVVTVQAEELNEIGVAYDFVELKRHLREVVERFDHVCLNDISPFDQVNPSSENIAAAIYREVETKLKGATARLVSAEVWDSPVSCATYTG